MLVSLAWGCRNSVKIKFIDKMTRFIVFRVSSDQRRVMPTSTKPAKNPPALRSSNPPHTITTPPLAFQTSPAPTNPSAPTPPPNRTTQIPAPPPSPSINSRHAREGRLATPHSHMPLALTLGFLGRTGRCCFYRSKTTSSQFLRSG